MAETSKPDKAVIAAGAYSKQLAAAAGDRVPLETERGYHVVISDPGVAPRYPVMPSDGKMAFAMTSAGLRVGGQVELAGLEAAPNWQRADVLLAFVRKVYPGVPEDLPPERIKHWMGHRPSMPDGLPCLGLASGSADIVHAFGHGHVGLTAGATTGHNCRRHHRRPAGIDRPDPLRGEAFRMTDLNGRIALVTGASRGIGRAIALALAEAGADVAVNFRNRATEAIDVVETIHTIGRRAIAVQADVSRGDAVSEMFRTIERSLGIVDILINNAGIAIFHDIDALTEEDFDHTIAVNLKSAFLCIRAAVPHMRERGWGRIVNISSGAARGAGGIGPHYNASKAGMEGLARGYAARLVKHGITVNSVAPSLIGTDMVQAGLSASLSRIPVGRFGTVDEVAQVVLMLIGNGYMTGQTVALSGGMSFS